MVQTKDMSHKPPTEGHNVTKETESTCCKVFQTFDLNDSFRLDSRIGMADVSVFQGRVSSCDCLSDTVSLLLFLKNLVSVLAGFLHSFVLVLCC